MENRILESDSEETRLYFFERNFKFFIRQPMIFIFFYKNILICIYIENSSMKKMTK